MKNKLITAQDAVSLIKDGDTIVPSGFIRSMVPDALVNALEERFLKTGHPCNLTLLHSASASEHFVGGSAGLNRLAHDGLLVRSFSGFYGHNDRFKQMISDGKIEAYNFPLGIISRVLRAYSCGQDGYLSQMGLKTYVDPAIEGGRWNNLVPKSGEWIRNVSFLGKDYLWYSTPKPNVALIRATSADEYGNLTMEEEALYSLSVNAAMAVHQNGGIVIAQVKNLCKGGTLDSQDVRIPGVFIDHIVVVSDPEVTHRQTSGAVYNPAFSGHFRLTAEAHEPMPLNLKKILCRRCAMELTNGAVVNLGTGTPEFISNVATEEGCQDDIILTVEAGAIGGSPLAGSDFGATANAWAYLDEDRMFDLYDGGGLDIAFLGLAETDGEGNVNVSRFNKKIMGCGGFIEITQATEKIVFLGSFTAGGLEVECEDGKLKILKEGKFRKFRNQIEQITFSGTLANENSKEVLYVTERAVFRLTSEGMELVEIAPGIDLERDILSQMDFLPVIGEVKEMDSKIFRPELMGLADYIN